MPIDPPAHPAPLHPTQPDTASPVNRGGGLAMALVSMCALATLVGCAGYQVAGPSTTVAPQVTAAPPAPAPPPLPKAKVEAGAYYHFIRGHQLEISRNYDLALSEYLAALTYAPTDKELLTRAATLYLTNGDVQGAVETAESALALYPDDSHLLLFLSKLYQREGDDALSDKTFRRLIALDPDNAKSYYLLVLSYIHQERFEDAEALITTVRKKDPDSALPDYYRGRIEQAKGNLARAASHWKRAIRRNPRFEAGYLDLAALYEDQGKRGKAKDLYETVVADVNPLSPLARDRLIQMYLEDRNLEQVLVHYDALLTFNPRNPTLLARKAMILAELDRRDEAIQSISRVLALIPSDIRTLEMLGSLYESEQRLDDARATYRRIIELDPSNVNAHVRIGYIASSQQNVAEREEMIQAAQALLEADPGNTNLHLFISWGQLRAKRYEEAVDVLQRALVVDPDNLAVHFSLGATYYELKRYEDMTREMRWVVDKDPNHAYALNFLSYSFAERGINLDEAISLVKRALVIVPHDGLFLDSLSWVYYKQGRYKLALKMQRKAIKQAADADPVLYDHLGSIYLALGRNTDARESWLQALERNPDDTDLSARFQEQGFGDPDQLERIIQARQRAAADNEGTPTSSPAGRP